MRGKIDLEGHFAIQDTVGDSERYFDADVWPKFTEKILGFTNTRLEEMDRYGIEKMVLSLNSPAVQAITDKKRAVEVAKKSNDIMAEIMQKHPDRFLGFAALPLQDPDAAVQELQRCVKELGCVGILANSFSQTDDNGGYKYYDDPIYRPFWAEVAKLDVPFYLHPREPMPCNIQNLDGHPWLEGAAWAFGVDTATHALRLMCSGILDENPNLKFILGHLGETLSFCIWRAQNRISKTNRGIPAKRPLTEYMQKNFWYTISGQYHTNSLINTMMEFGSDRILFATDFPFETIEDASVWFDNCEICENDKYKIGRQNAIDLFKLNTK